MFLVGGKCFFVKKMFIYVMLRLYNKFQCSTMPGTGQKVCGGGGVVVVVVVVWWWLKPTLVFSLAQAEQL